MAEIDCPFPTPPVDLFAEVVSKESDWYTLATFLGAPTNELDHIERTYNKDTLLRHYIEVYKCLEKLEKPLTWKHIVTSLRRMENNALAGKIKKKFVIPFKECIPSSSGDREFQCVKIKGPLLKQIAKEYKKLSERLTVLLTKVKLALAKKSKVEILAIQEIIERECGDQLHPSLSDDPEEERFEVIFKTLNKRCSILNFRVLSLIADNFLKRNILLRKHLADLEKDIDKDFKSSVRMGQLVDLIKEKQAISDNDKKVKLKVVEFWEEFTIKRFEKEVAAILHTLYEVTSQIRVTKGCICINGVIPVHIDATKLVRPSNSPEESEFANNMGVSFLHIESPSTVSPPIEIYKFESTEKPRTLEEAVSRCKNARAKHHLQVIERENFEWKKETKIEHYQTRLEQPVQIITVNYNPAGIAFSNNGDMFVTSVDHLCIHVHVYDKSGNKKIKNTIIRSWPYFWGFPFTMPIGIDINGDIVYVCDLLNHRIHKLTTRGEFIGTFGEEVSGLGQFNPQFKRPWGVQISPDGKVYVADHDNHRIQVFLSDGTISHVIDGSVSGVGNFDHPAGIAFDLSSNLHVTEHNSVKVFTPSGQFIRQYGESPIRPIHIAIDSSGYSLVTSDGNNTLSVFDPRGTLIHSIGGFNYPFSIAISPTDGGVWVADYLNQRLVKY